MTIPLYTKLNEDIKDYASSANSLDATELIGFADASQRKELSEKLITIFRDVKNIMEKEPDSNKELAKNLLNSAKSLVISTEHKTSLVKKFLEALNLKAAGQSELEGMLELLEKRPQSGARAIPQQRGQATPFSAARSGEFTLRRTRNNPPSKEPSDPDAPPVPPREDEISTSPKLPPKPRQSQSSRTPVRLNPSSRDKSIPPPLPPRDDVEESETFLPGGRGSNPLQNRGRPPVVASRRPIGTLDAQGTAMPAQPVPGRRKRDPSFLTKGKPVETPWAKEKEKIAFNNVGELSKKIAAQFDQSVQIQIQHFVNNLRKDVRDYSTTLFTDIKAQEAVDEHVGKVMEKVEEDLNKHLIQINDDTDPRLIDKIKGDINAYLQGVPAGMTMQQFLAYAFLYRSYESCLEMDIKKWEGLANETLSEEERQKSVQIETTLNYFELFHRRTADIESIAGFKEAGKRIRTLEAHVTAKGYKKKYDRSVAKYEKYIQNGNLATALDEQFLGHRSIERIAAPKKIPGWLTDALAKK